MHWTVESLLPLNDPTDHWQNGLNRVGSKMRFYRLRNNQHQRNKLIFRIAWARINISLIWKKNTGWVRINGTIIFLYPDFVRRLLSVKSYSILVGGACRLSRTNERLAFNSANIQPQNHAAKDFDLQPINLQNIEFKILNFSNFLNYIQLLFRNLLIKNKFKIEIIF